MIQSTGGQLILDLRLISCSQLIYDTIQAVPDLVNYEPHVLQYCTEIVPE